MKNFGVRYNGDAPTSGLISLEGAAPISRANSLSVSGWCRLANEAALRLALSLPATSDIETILMSGWQAWKHQLADRLRGEFVFAIADKAAGTLYVARDPLGLKPCYFHRDGAVILCADSSVALRRAIPAALEPDRIVLSLFLEGRTWGHTRTFFHGIERLPPGHYLAYGDNGSQITQYWSASAVPRRTDTADATAEFRALFDASVARDYAPGRTGLLLSGGLDSSAIAGTLAHQLGPGSGLATVSMTYPEPPDWNDRPHLQAPREAYDFSTHDLPSDEHDPLVDADFYLRTLDGPWFPYGQMVSFRAKAWLRDQGRDIVLTGHGGDEIVSHGLGRLNELAREGRWLTLARESRAGAALQGTRHLATFLVYTDHVPAIRRARRRWGRKGRISAPANQSILNADLRREMVRTEPTDPIPTLSRPDHDDRMVQEDAVMSPLYAKAFENIALCSRALGIETRMPFCDRDLVELSLSLPSSTKLRGGWTRRILREAMRGRVPESVLRRKTKYDFGDNFVRGLLAHRERLLDETAPENTRLCDLLDTAELERLRARVSQGGTGFEREDAYRMWRVAVAARWQEIERQAPSAAGNSDTSP